MKGKLKYLFLFFVSCGNDHFRGQSDYHFTTKPNPELMIKFKKVGTDDFFITQIKDSTSKVLVQNDNKNECVLQNFEIDEDDDMDKVTHEKVLTIICSDNQEFFMKINFSRRFQLVNYEIGIGKIYKLTNIDTNIPAADIKTDYKNKILYSSTYSRENVVEIEY